MADDKKKGDPNKFVDKDGEGTTIRDEKGNIVKTDKKGSKAKKSSLEKMDVGKSLHEIGIRANLAIAAVEDKVVEIGKKNGFSVSRSEFQLREDYADLILHVKWESTSSSIPQDEDDLDRILFQSYQVRFEVTKSFPKLNMYRVKGTVRWPL